MIDFTQTLLGTLDMKFEMVTADKVVISMPVGPKVHQPYGLLHGGASVALAETVASVGAIANLEEGKQSAVGQEINANHLRPVKEGTITATGTPIYRGKRSQVWHIEIKDEAERLICISRCTMAVIDL
ncbi:MAG: hotdog fold thioesterase [Deinococcales bacterium]